MNPPHDLLIGEEYWNFLGGENTYQELLAIFEKIGLIYKETLKAKFSDIVGEKYTAQN